MAGKSTGEGKAKAPAKPKADPNSLTVIGDGRSTEQLVAELAVEPNLVAATVTRAFAKATLGELDLAATLAAVAAVAKAAQNDGMRSAETMLIGQASALNMVFAELSRRAALNMGDYPQAFERYMRLALKAQAQCRASLEALAAIKNPPVIYARQANIANGPQQVNNAVKPDNPDTSPAPARACGSENAKAPNGLLEPSRDGARLDA